MVERGSVTTILNYTNHASNFRSVNENQELKKKRKIGRYECKGVVHRRRGSGATKLISHHGLP